MAFPLRASFCGRVILQVDRYELLQCDDHKGAIRWLTAVFQVQGFLSLLWSSQLISSSWFKHLKRSSEVTSTAWPSKELKSFHLDGTFTSPGPMSAKARSPSLQPATPMLKVSGCRLAHTGPTTLQVISSCFALDFLEPWVIQQTLTRVLATRFYFTVNGSPGGAWTPAGVYVNVSTHCLPLNCWTKQSVSDAGFHNCMIEVKRVSSLLWKFIT